MTVSIGGLPLSTSDETTARFTFLFWGKIGTGKTPLAMTAPAPILYLQFDYDGDKSVTHVKHRFRKLDMTTVDDTFLDNLKKGSLFMNDLDKLLSTGEYKTVVLDSVTALMERLLLRGIERVAPMVTKGVKPTSLAPGLQGYGARSALVRDAIMALHAVTAKYNVNLVLTCHEKQPDLNSDGSTNQITMMLAGETYIQVPKNISEVWLIRDVDNQRRIYVRNWNFYEPMRTRMFDVGNSPYFVWNFNANTWEGPGQLEKWIEQWRTNSGMKIPLPK